MTGRSDLALSRMAGFLVFVVVVEPRDLFVPKPMPSSTSKHANGFSAAGWRDEDAGMQPSRTRRMWR